MREHNQRPGGIVFYAHISKKLMTRSVKKALLLAGGSGSRLRPATHTYAKQLLPIANRPVLFYGLEAIRAAGITDVGIVVGHTQRSIETAVGDGMAFGLSVTYIPQGSPHGLAHAVLVARDYLGNENFVMYLGDSFVAAGIGGVVDDFVSNFADAQIMLASVSNPQRFGVAQLDETGEVVGLDEKPTRPKSNLALVGVYLFTSAVHDAVSQLSPSPRGEFEITEAIQWLVDSGHKVRSTMTAGYWKDIGNVADILDANRVALEGIAYHVRGEVDRETELSGQVFIEAGAVVRKSRITGPAVIGAGVRISDSYVGPFTSIADNCIISQTEISNSIVLNEAEIYRSRRIAGSLIGRNAKVIGVEGNSGILRLVLGDDSEIQMSDEDSHD